MSKTKALWVAIGFAVLTEVIRKAYFFASIIVTIIVPAYMTIYSAISSIVIRQAYFQTISLVAGVMPSGIVLWHAKRSTVFPIVIRMTYDGAVCLITREVSH
jgi:hypothetical protein